MRRHEKKLRPVHPDEWGFYDPDQAGVAAVVARLDGRWRHARLTVRDGKTILAVPPGTQRRPKANE